MVRYINFKSVHGTETVDQLDRKDFTTFKEFSKELKRLVAEYNLSGMAVYVSQRADKNWKTK